MTAVGATPHLPHLDHPGMLQLATAAVPLQAWLEPVATLTPWLQHKRAQRAALQDRVSRADAASLPAQRELAELLAQHLCSAHGGHYRRARGRLYRDDEALDWPVLDTAEPLWNASLWVPDDLLLLQTIRGEHVLTAGSLCSASHWALEDKLLRPLAALHGPVPDIELTLMPRMQRLLDRLAPGRPLVRHNWGLQRGDALNRRPDGTAAVETAMRAGLDEPLDAVIHYRVERQSLLRLPRSAAIAFSIRVILYPLATVAAVPGALPALRAAIDALPPAQRRYKGL